MQCKRIVFKRPKEVTIEDAEVPPPSKGRILVKIPVTLISTGTELTMLSRRGFPKGSSWEKIAKYPKMLRYANRG